MLKAIQTIRELPNKIIFFDQDGVIADYDYEGSKSLRSYDEKRPIKTIVKLVKQMAAWGYNIIVLTLAYSPKQVEEKSRWLKKNLPFLDAKNIVILLKDMFPNYCDEAIKLDAITTIVKERQVENIVVIDDTISILNTVKSMFPQAVCYHISSLIE